MTLSRRLAPFFIAATLVGCGGGDEPAETTPTPVAPAADALALDAEAKSAARNAVVELEACFVDEQDYRRCKDRASGVENVDASLAEYTVVARSESGSEFSVTKEPNGSLSRTCTPAGEGGCEAAGSW